MPLLQMEFWSRPRMTPPRSSLVNRWVFGGLTYSTTDEGLLRGAQVETPLDR